MNNKLTATELMKVMENIQKFIKSHGLCQKEIDSGERQLEMFQDELTLINHTFSNADTRLNVFIDVTLNATVGGLNKAYNNILKDQTIPESVNQRIKKNADALAPILKYTTERMRDSLIGAFAEEELLRKEKKQK